MSTESKPSGGHSGHDGPSASHGGSGPSDSNKKRKMDMPTFGDLFYIRYYIPHVGGVQLVREVTASQAIAGILTAIAVFWLSGFVIEGPWQLFPTVVGAGGAGMIVSRVDSGGRSVGRELFRMFAFIPKCRLHHGAAPVGRSKKRRRLESMIAREKARVSQEPTVAEIVFGGIADIASDIAASLSETRTPRRKTRRNDD